MGSDRLVLNETSYHGAGCIREIVTEVIFTTSSQMW